MSEDNNKNLPSIDDFSENPEELPSVDEFLKEEELPSVEEFVEEEKQELIVEEKIEEPITEAMDLTEIVRLVNDVRDSIPDIPEIKSYDSELQELSENLEQLKNSIPKVPEVKYYDTEVEAICEQIDLVREEVKNLPEVKYYDEQLNLIEEKIQNLPEPKYYDGEIEAICEAIDKVREEIPTFPKWVNEVNEVPDFSWIGKTFSVIDDDFVKVGDHIKDLKTKFDSDLEELTENLDLKDFEQRIKIDELNKAKDKIYEELKEAAIKIWAHHDEFKDDDRKLKKSILSKLNETRQNIEKQISELDNKSYESDKNLKGYFEGLKEEIANLPEVKYYDDNITELKKDLYNLDKKYKDTSTNIAELYKIVEEIKGGQEELKEGLLNEPPTYAQSVGGPPDPLTPLGKKFATLEDLSKNYTLFVNRVQQQLATFGGGGAVRVDTMDDVGISTYAIGSELGIATGSLLIYDENLKLVGIASTALGGSTGVGGTDFISGIAATFSSKVTTDFLAGIAATFSGNVTVGGTITYQDVTHQDVLGIGTFQQGVQILNNGLSVNTGIVTVVPPSGIGTVTIGAGDTSLVVDGDARVIGILTVGRASITIDGDNNQVTVGLVTITNSEVVLGENVTINASATGINSAPNVLYVAKDGNDSNNGTSIDNAFLTIKAAVGIATSETTIKVLAGNYVEDNPITLPAFSAVIGDDLRTVKVLPSNTTQDIFHVNKGTKLANMTFSGHVSPSAAVAFPTAGATNVGGGKWKGPYVQNCTSDTTTGTGIRIDGDLAVKTKSMNVDAFTQYNQGGVGVAVTNEGYAQLVSVFTICCDQAITAHKGGQADVANSNCSFGTLGLVADGIGSQQFIGTVTSEAEAAQDNITVNIGEETTRPYDGQVVFFDRLYQSVETITVGSGGTGYTSTPSVTIGAPSGPNGETATAFATLEGESVASITIISSGSQYESTPEIVISGPNVGVNTATATLGMAPTYYTINSSTPVTSGITTLTLAENLINTVGVGSTTFFFQQSKIVASSHTFEYIGSGNTITLATPKRGGVTIQENEVVTTNGGNVVYTSTDQSGNFRIGDELQINQTTGTISGRSFSKSLFSEMTPFILALS